MIDALLRLFAVQPGPYRILVRVFWRLSMRAPTSLMAQQVGKTEGKPWKAWLLYVLFGLFVSILAALGMPRPIFGAIVCGSALLIIGMAVVADFAVFVMAPGDDEILFHRPLTSRTYLAARLTVAGMHVSILALCYGFFPALLSLNFDAPLYPPLLLVSLIATALFSMLIAFAIYRAGLRLLGGPRLESLLTFLPALFSILTFIVPQMLIGSLKGEAGARIEPVLNYLPPAWFSSIPEALLGRHDPDTLLRAALGVAVLPLGFWFLVAAMGRGFLDDLLALISSRGVGRGSASAAGRPAHGAALATRDPEMAAGYLLYVGATRSRDARGRMAPVLLMPIAFLLLAIFREGMGGFSGFLAIYLVGAGSGTILATVVFHEHYHAAWLYGAAPIHRFGHFVRGVAWAMLMRHIVPVYLLVFLVVLIRNPSPLTFFGGIHAFLAGCVSIPYLARHIVHPPFSRQFQPSEQTAQMAIYFISMFIVSLFGIAHFVIVVFAPWAFAVTIPLLLWLDVGWMRRVAARLDRAPPLPIGPVARA